MVRPNLFSHVHPYPSLLSPCPSHHHQHHHSFLSPQKLSPSTTLLPEGSETDSPYFATTTALTFSTPRSNSSSPLSSTAQIQSFSTSCFRTICSGATHMAELAVQVNRFDCGRLAIGVCMSHKLSDAATVVSFVNCWASIARNAAEEVSFPVLHVASDLFRRGDLPLPEAVHKTGCYASRRFVFEAEKIDVLKALISGQVQDNPTRVEAVTALLCKSVINSSNSASETSNTPTTRHLLVQQVNMRPRMAPTLPETAVGSLSWFFPVSTPEESSGMEQFLGALVCRMRKGLNKLCTNFAEEFGGEDWFLAVGEILKEQRGFLRRSDQEVLRFSSWCRFPVFE